MGVIMHYPTTPEKLEELSLIYGSYEAQLAQTAMDPGDRQQLAAQMLDASFFAGWGITPSLCVIL